MGRDNAVEFVDVYITWGLDTFWRKIKGWLGLWNELYEDRDGLKATVQNIWHWLWGLGLSFCLELFSFGVLILILFVLRCTYDGRVFFRIRIPPLWFTLRFTPRFTLLWVLADFRVTVTPSQLTRSPYLLLQQQLFLLHWNFASVNLTLNFKPFSSYPLIPSDWCTRRDFTRLGILHSTSLAPAASTRG